MGMQQSQAAEGGDGSCCSVLTQYRKSRDGRSLVRKQTTLVLKRKTPPDSDEASAPPTTTTTPARLASSLKRRRLERAQAVVEQALLHSRNKTLKRKRKAQEYCLFFNKFGKCNKGADCPYQHDPDKVRNPPLSAAYCTPVVVVRALLWWWVWSGGGVSQVPQGPVRRQGLPALPCEEDHDHKPPGRQCATVRLLSHGPPPWCCRVLLCVAWQVVSRDKMPVCEFFLRGACNNDDCPYSHVKVPALLLTPRLLLLQPVGRLSYDSSSPPSAQLAIHRPCMMPGHDAY